MYYSYFAKQTLKGQSSKIKPKKRFIKDKKIKSESHFNQGNSLLKNLIDYLTFFFKDSSQ